MKTKKVKAESALVLFTAVAVAGTGAWRAEAQVDKE